MTMIAPDAEVERVELAPAAALFRSLGDPARLMIVRRLAGGPARVTDLVAALGLAQSTVSKHLACLRDCGLVTSEPSGRASVFRLAQPALADMLTAAETVLAATGNAVALCPEFGLDACARTRRDRRAPGHASPPFPSRTPAARRAAPAGPRCRRSATPGGSARPGRRAGWRGPAWRGCAPRAASGCGRASRPGRSR